MNGGSVKNPRDISRFDEDFELPEGTFVEMHLAAEEVMTQRGYAPSRAKIPPDQEKAFTDDVLTLNRRFFRDVWVDIHLDDTDPQFQELMKSIGFKGKAHLNDLCAWHQDHLLCR